MQRVPTVARPRFAAHATPLNHCQRSTLADCDHCGGNGWLTVTNNLKTAVLKCRVVSTRDAFQDFGLLVG